MLSIIRGLRCRLGFHRYEFCEANHQCDKPIRKCRDCLDISCKTGGNWQPCDSNNPCEWSFGCGFKREMKGNH